MTDNITLTGLVATVPKHLTTGDGLHITSFRMASAQSRYDRTANKWVEIDTNWYTITAFRRLALGAAGSIGKGDHVVVTGKLRVRDWKSTDRSGTTVEIDADAIGHDLTWGTSAFTRTMAASNTEGALDQASPEANEDRFPETVATPDAVAEVDSESAAIDDQTRESVGTPF